MVLHIADVFVYNRELDFLDFTHEESWSKWMNSPWDEQFTQKCSFHQLGENSLLNRKLIIFSIRKYHVYLYLSYLCWYFPFSASFCLFFKAPHGSPADLGRGRPYFALLSAGSGRRNLSGETFMELLVSFSALVLSIWVCIHGVSPCHLVNRSLIVLMKLAGDTTTTNKPILRIVLRRLLRRGPGEVSWGRLGCGRFLIYASMSKGSIEKPHTSLPRSSRYIIPVSHKERDEAEGFWLLSRQFVMCAAATRSPLSSVAAREKTCALEIQWFPEIHLLCQCEVSYWYLLIIIGCVWK